MWQAMESSLASLAPASAAVAAAVGAIAVLAVALGRRSSPSERERRRRLEVNARGRLVCGMVLDVEQDALQYSYSVGGAEYSAAQDISSLWDLIPEEPTGPVLVKYLPSNPANSIVVCEEWSGLRRRNGAAQ